MADKQYTGPKVSRATQTEQDMGFPFDEEKVHISHLKKQVGQIDVAVEKVTVRKIKVDVRGKHVIVKFEDATDMKVTITTDPASPLASSSGPIKSLTITPVSPSLSLPVDDEAPPPYEESPETDAEASSAIIETLSEPVSHIPSEVTEHHSAIPTERISLVVTVSRSLAKPFS